MLRPHQPLKSAALLWAPTGLLQAAISTVPMGLSWKTYTNTDGLSCHPDLKALLKHGFWLCCHCWQEYWGLEEAEGFANRRVTLAQSKPTAAYARRDKASLFLSTHLYSVHCHTVRSNAGGKWLTCMQINTGNLCKAVKTKWKHTKLYWFNEENDAHKTTTHPLYHPGRVTQDNHITAVRTAM